MAGGNGGRTAGGDETVRVIRRLADLDRGQWAGLVAATLADARSRGAPAAGDGPAPGPGPGPGDAALDPLIAPSGLPFMDWRYLTALEETGCVGGRSGWEPRHLLIERGREPVAACVLYRKAHSYGEYVFDWAWANAYQQHGLAYYPKGLVASPFTPVPGPRLLAVDDAARRALLTALTGIAEQEEWSSLHLLFAPELDARAALAAGWLQRSAFQFHWTNPGYRDFDDFLARLTQPKRKKILAERRKVREAGVIIECREGEAISAADWQLFARCYQMTYALHHSTPYLNRHFFERLGQAMPEHLVMFIARDQADGEAIAASLLFHDGQTLYGRYWGALRWVPCLHFEASYYAPMAWAIAKGLSRFEGGAQGEHKMARGFLPVRTQSLHWLAHPAFFDAVAQFLRRERGGVEEYLDELDDRSPMRAAMAAASEPPPT